MGMLWQACYVRYRVRWQVEGIGPCYGSRRSCTQASAWNNQKTSLDCQSSPGQEKNEEPGVSNAYWTHNPAYSKVRSAGTYTKV